MRASHPLRSISLLFVLIAVMLSGLLGLAAPALAEPLHQRTVSLSPISGPPGTQVTVSGTGWTHNSNNKPYEIRWKEKDGVLLGKFQTDSGGNFSKTVTIPRGEPRAGERKIWVCEGCRSGSPQTEFWVGVTFTVTPWPTPTPPPTRCDVAGTAGETVIDFESFDSETSLFNESLPEGVTFTYHDPLVIQSELAHSASNALLNSSRAEEFGSAGKPLEIAFDYVQDFVGMYVGVAEDEGHEFTATLTAWGEDDLGNPVSLATDQETLGPNAMDISECLWVEVPGEILRVTLSYGVGAEVGTPELIDDLVIRGPEEPVPVPMDDTPPQVLIRVPEEGETFLSEFVSFEGDIIENRSLERVELWVNDAFVKELGAARMGSVEYFFLDSTGREDGLQCGMNQLRVVAFDDAGNSGEDRVQFNYEGVGDLWIDAVEPVQALFDAPLIHGKNTAFRVQLSSSFICPVDTEVRLSLPGNQWETTPPLSEGHVIGLPPDWTYPEIWGPIEIPANATRFPVMLPYIPQDETSESFSADASPTGLLDPHVVSGVHRPNMRVLPRPIGILAEASVEVDPRDRVVETQETNNEASMAEFEVVDTRGLSLYFIPYVFNFEPSPEDTISGYEFYLRERGYTDPDGWVSRVRDALTEGSVPISVALTEEDVARLEDDARRYAEFMLGAYPFAESEVSYRIGGRLYFEEDYIEAQGGNPCHKGIFHSGMDTMVKAAYPDVDVIILFTIFGCCGQSPGVYVDAGLSLTGSHPKWHHERINLDLTPADDDYYCWNWDLDYNPAAEYVIGHELCHYLLGMRGECYACGDPDHEHVTCSTCRIDVDGFWVNRWVEIPMGTPYFMDSICGGCLYWIRLEPSENKSGGENPDGYLNAIDRFSVDGDPTVVLVRGTIARSGEASFKPFWILEEGTTDLRLQHEGMYTIAMVDSMGRDIATWGIDISFLEHPPAPQLPRLVDEMYFDYKVEFLEGTTRIELRNREGEVLAGREVSAHSPTFQMIEPNGGEIWNLGRSYPIRWEAKDLDGDTLTFSLAISSDGGETWQPLACDIEEQSFTLNTIGHVEGDEYRIRILASDGVNTSECQSGGSFSITSEKPFSQQFITIIALGFIALLGLALIVAGFLFYRMRGRVRS
jgi:hypothetical protein